jgi:hypothetical protein
MQQIALSGSRTKGEYNPTQATTQFTGIMSSYEKIREYKYPEKIYPIYKIEELIMLGNYSDKMYLDRNTGGHTIDG